MMAESNARHATAPPLCVDLDGTLIRSDLLWESIALLLRRQPGSVFLLPWWLLRGRAYLKRQVSTRVKVDPVALPYNPEILNFLKQQRAEGRRLYLVTASDAWAAEAVAGHIGLFQGVIASDGRDNVKAERKRDILVERFGANGYDYAGNSSVDLPVWKESRAALVVNASSEVRRRAEAGGRVAGVFDLRRTAYWKAGVRAIRVHQWVKNTLVFLPVLTAHKFFDLETEIAAAMAFAAFSLCASSAYVLNDLLDLEADRAHASKRTRPFASGELSIPLGFGLAALLLAGGVGIALLLPREFAAILALYYGVTLAYSLQLKRKLLIDVYILGGLYTIRVFGGGAATGIIPSPWLLAFCLFLFSSLALVKRFSELRDAAGAVAGRGYLAADLNAIGALGTSSGFMCVLVLALYINSPQVTPLYHSPGFLWFLCPLLMYWISRVWVIAYRGEMHMDPVVFALRDRISYVMLAVAGIVLLVASKWQ
jgi:4-hydroxybenzoate polyprenyltransferase/phosphoserine phosphatase